MPRRAERGRCLSRWGDPGWGELVATGKRGGHFSDELVAGVAEMIQERWQPDPWPEWVTGIPSLRHPELVPGFARRLAAALELPYRVALRKTRETEAQKRMENAYHQARNLDGVFEVIRTLEGPVLLVDDILDSGWTLTIGSALLLEAGSGPVFPLTLASTGSW